MNKLTNECIRSSLDVMKDKRCPVCDASITEGSIRRNRVLEEFVDSWQEARPVAIKLCQTPAAGPSRKRPTLEREMSSGIVGKKSRANSVVATSHPEPDHETPSGNTDEPTELSENGEWYRSFSD